MQEKEALEKSAGFVGTNILIRLRLENKSASGVLTPAGRGRNGSAGLHRQGEKNDE